MNTRGRDALVQAALNGIRQLRDGRVTDNDGGRCALGVLCDYGEYPRDFMVTHAEATGIIHANDVLGWDFLTIAQKFHNPEHDLLTDKETV